MVEAVKEQKINKVKIKEIFLEVTKLLEESNSAIVDVVIICNLVLMNVAIINTDSVEGENHYKNIIDNFINLIDDSKENMDTLLCLHNEMQQSKIKH